MTKAAEKTVAANFDRYYRVDDETGCWEWLGGKCKGYGQLKVDGRVQKAYRFSYERAKGPIPVGGHVLHSCANKGCVNPDHLRVGTHADNMRDRSETWHQPFGQGAPNAKLTQEQVDEIRALVAGGMMQRVVARKHGVSQTTISDICLFKSWPKETVEC